jgi:MFS family permease
MLGAGVAMATGAVLLSRIGVSSSTVAVLVALMVFGIGNGLVNAPITQAAVSGMPAAQAGVASSIGSTSRQVGQSLGIAVAGSILAAGLHGRTLRTGFVAASHPGWLVLAGCGAMVCVLGLIVSTRWARDTVTRTAALFEPEASGAQPPQPQAPPQQPPPPPAAGPREPATPPTATVDSSFTVSS